MSRRRRARSLGSLSAALVLLVSACAPLPATGPRLATGNGPGGQAHPADQVDTAAPPDWLAPESDLDWAPCADDRDPGIPTGTQIDCALLGQTPTLRLSNAATPDDAAPLVVVAGAENPPDELVMRLAATGTEIVDTRPIVILDHRGRTGAAGTCLTYEARRILDHLADRDFDATAPETRGDLATAAQSCTDMLAGEELHYSSVAPAQDLESLRQKWGVPGLALLGIGTGARTAVAYAGSNPGRVSMLVLDSPAPLAGDQEAATRSALDGSDAALRLWAASCTRDECGDGDATDKVDAITRALDTARDPGARIPAALLSDVIRAALGDLSGASGDSAAPGDALLGDLVDADPERPPESVRALAGELSSSSLSFVAGCSDLSTRVPVNRVSELASEWEDEPPFGQILAAQLSACSTWPVPGPSPVELPGLAPVLLLSGIADPVAGAAPLESTAGMLTAAGASDLKTVTWGAPGSRVVLHSACARSSVVDFLSDPAAAEESAACPS